MTDTRREAERATLDLPVTLTVFAHLEDERADARERNVFDYVAGTATAVESMTTRALGDVHRGLRTLHAYVRALDAEARDGRRTEDADTWDALWELSDDLGFHDAYVVEFVEADIRRALEGHAREFHLGYWATRTATTPALRIECIDISFERGSLKTTLKLLIKGAPLALTILGWTALPVAQDQFERLRVQQEVRMIYGDERCLTTSVLNIDGKALLDAMAPELNFPAAASQEQRQRAVCLSQLALALSGFPVGPIDGIDGPKTWTQLDAFARSRGYKDSKDPAVFRELATALHHGARSLIRK